VVGTSRAQQSALSIQHSARIKLTQALQDVFATMLFSRGFFAVFMMF